jgi:3-oxoadipate enol-lactonase
VIAADAKGQHYVDRCEQGIAWREAGTGSVVVFLHGLGGTRTAWGSQLRSLSAHFRCVAWDMPGYGESDPITPLTFPGVAAQLLRLIDILEAPQVDLVGLSFGGMHAMHAALHAPARIRRMVLADTSPAFGIDGTKPDEWMAARLAPIDAGGSPADIADVVVDAITAVQLSGIVRDETVGAFSRISPAGFRAAVECLPSNDVRARLHDIPHPSLVIVGELDEETPPSYAAIIHDGLPHSRLEVLPGVGHLSPAEAPDRFNELVAEFLLADNPVLSQ